MPPYKQSVEAFNRRIVKDFPSVFRCDEKILFCRMCDIVVNAKQLFQVKQHLETAKHIASVKRKSGESSSQELITNLSDSATDRDANKFTMDLVQTFLNANIPLNKVCHPSIQGFIENYTKYAVPSVSKLRTKCVPLLYEKCRNKLKQIAQNNFIWVSIDETTDCEQRFVANFIFGVLGVEEEKERCHLFASKQIEVTNSVSMAKFFDECVLELGKSI